MHRRAFLQALGAAAGMGLLPRLGPDQAAGVVGRPPRPNVIILIADDLAWNDVGCFGHPTIRTPHLDRMAAEGMRFTSAFLTAASCSPTRCSVITGRYPHATGAAELHQPLPADQVAFPGLLKAGGYYTAAAGKWHMGDDARRHFDRIYGGGPSGGEQWLRALRERPNDRPFLMWLAASDPHRPYRPDTIDPPHRPEDMVVPPFLPDVPEVRHDLALYCDEVSRLDAFVGRVLDEVDRQGIGEDTCILFFSDNGRPFPRCKTRLYDSGVKTPLLVRWPGHIEPGTVCDSLVSVIDFAPTILHLAGLPASETFQGVSFAPLLRDPAATTRDCIFAEHNWHDYQAHERAARSKDFLYIRNAFPHLPGTPPADAVRSETFQMMRRLRGEGLLSAYQHDCFILPRPAEELYDVNKDPYSLRNVADDPAYADALGRMRAVLDDWIRRTDDRIPATPTPDRFDRATGQSLAR